jgi:Rieske Fe-S protein
MRPEERADQPEERGDQLLDRRKALKLTGAALGAVAAGTGLTLGAAAVGPSFRTDRRGWLRVGPVADFPEGRIVLAEFRPPVAAEWPALDQRVACYVWNQGSGEFVVYDIHCTHVGCPVRWNASAKRFFSPCHGGVFDQRGRVLGGPPPRPLDRREWKVEDGILYVGAIYRVNENLQRTT